MNSEIPTTQTLGVNRKEVIILTENCSRMVSSIFSVMAVSVICMSMLSSCASMVSTDNELQNVGENEGIVFGSFVINVEKGEENKSGWAFLGQKASDATYEVSISKRESNPFKLNYLIRATPEKEEIFIKKLPAGNYYIHAITKLGFSNLKMNFRVNFRVIPKRTTYIGKLIVQFPSRIRQGSPARMNVVDTQQKSTELLKTEYEKSLSEVIEELMTIQR